MKKNQKFNIFKITKNYIIKKNQKYNHHKNY